MYLYKSIIIFMVMQLLDIFSVVIAGGPVQISTYDLTGQEFDSICGQSGIFLSGTIHQSFRSECTITKEGIFTCTLEASFKFSDALVSIDNLLYILTEVSRLVLGFSSGIPGGGISTTDRRLLVANMIQIPSGHSQSGSGLISRFYGNLKCESTNGVLDCKVDKFDFDCT